MRIFLVRHGMSQANADWNTNQEMADHAIPLTPEGRTQALEAGAALQRWFADNLIRYPGRVTFSYGTDERKITMDGPAIIPRIRLWHSPYLRTRETAKGIVQACRLGDFEVEIEGDEPMCRTGRGATVNEDGCADPNYFGDSWFFDGEDAEPVPHAREHILLAEQQFGIFDGLSDKEREQHYPREQAYYEKCKKYEGKLWPKMPLGESRFEVCQRVHQSFGTFHRDAERHGIENIVVVGHGTTNRAFVQMWLHKPWEWMHKERNPRNCSIRLIEDGEDKGYIFEGFDNPDGYKHKVNKETEE